MIVDHKAPKMANKPLAQRLPWTRRHVRFRHFTKFEVEGSQYVLRYKSCQPSHDVERPSDRYDRIPYKRKQEQGHLQQGNYHCPLNRRMLCK